MTTIVVKGNDEIAIAADALVTFGQTRLPHGYAVNEKIFQVGGSYIGLAGSTAHLSDPVESSQITAVIANPTGIYGVDSNREVFSFERFWGIGSGRISLGAMCAAYDRLKSARAIAELGVEAGAEFDKRSALPARVFSLPQAGAEAT